MEEDELREIRRIARRNRTTVAEWVRQALRSARRQVSPSDRGKKLEAVRTAVRHTFPTGEISAMLAEIERGYQGGAAG